MTRVLLFDAARLGARARSTYLQHSHIELEPDGRCFLVIQGARALSTSSLDELLRRLRVDREALRSPQ